MRLLVEILVVSMLIYLGWDTPFKQWGDRANTAIQKLLHQKRQTPPPGVTTIIAPIAPWETGQKTFERSGAPKSSVAHYKPSRFR
jgi:hypothetical protein